MLDLDESLVNLRGHLSDLCYNLLAFLLMALLDECLNKAPIDSILCLPLSAHLTQCFLDELLV